MDLYSHQGVHTAEFQVHMQHTCHSIRIMVRLTIELDWYRNIPVDVRFVEILPVDSNIQACILPRVHFPADKVEDR